MNPTYDAHAFIEEYRSARLHETNKNKSALAIKGTTNSMSKLRLGNGVAAFCASGVSACFCNPLDCLRVRWQLLSKHDMSSIYRNSLTRYSSDVIATEGLIQGLWRPGLTCNVLGMGTSACVRFGMYEVVRDGLASTAFPGHGNDSNALKKEKRPQDMLLAGLLCGLVGSCITTPFHLIKTLQQAETAELAAASNNVGSGSAPKVITVAGFLKRAFRKGDVCSRLFNGVVPVSIRGSVFTAGQMMGYDGTKTIAQKQYQIPDGPTLHVASAIISSLCVAFLTTPADLIVTRLMNHNNHRASAIDTMKIIYRENNGNIFGFWRGFGVFFLRLTPVMLAYATVYEQLRKQFGLGYMS